MKINYYKITNIKNNKIYIGQTKRKINKRWQSHVYDANYTTHKFPILNAIRKYGSNSFIVELIEECEMKSMKDALQKEFDYIKQFNSSNPKIGYNVLDSFDKWKKMLNNFHYERVKNNVHFSRQGCKNYNRDCVGVRKNFIGKWSAHIEVDGKKYGKHNIETKEEAMEIYDMLAITLRDKKANLNYPNKKYIIPSNFLEKLNIKDTHISKYKNIYFNKQYKTWYYEICRKGIRYIKSGFLTEIKAFNALQKLLFIVSNLN